jgi:hypothetical protein
MNDFINLKTSFNLVSKALFDSVAIENDKLCEKKQKLKVLKNKLGDSSQTNYVIVNCGGNCFEVDRRALNSDLTFPQFRFVLMSGRFDHLLPKDKNGRIFLDLDAKWMQPHVSLLQDLEMWDGEYTCFLSYRIDNKLIRTICIVKVGQVP